MSFIKKDLGSLNRYSKKSGNSITPPHSMFSPKRASDVDHLKYKKRKKHKIHIHQSSSTQPSSQNVLETSISKSASSLYPTVDSSDDEGLIDIEKLISTSSTRRSDDKPEPVNQEVEGHSEEETEDIKSDIDQEDDTNPILNSLSKHSPTKIASIKEKHKDKSIPNPISSRKELITRAEKHFNVIPKILRGKHTPSFYYELAKKQKENSIHETMGAVEKWNINWELYYGGYYGLKRQSIIGTIIQNRFQQELKRSSKTNRTVSYWTTPRFCTYILANEIIIRMIMEDMNCNFDKAEEIIRTTTDYGIVVADSVEVEFDLEDTDDSLSEEQSSITGVKDSLLDQILSS